MNFNFIIPKGEWVETYPTTNGKQIIGMRLASAYFWVNMILMAFGAYIRYAHLAYEIPDSVIRIDEGMGYFIIAMLGLGVTQFGIKRKTSEPAMQPTTSETATGEPVAVPKAVVVPTPPAAPVVVAPKPAAPALPKGAMAWAEPDHPILATTEYDRTVIDAED